VAVPVVDEIQLDPVITQGGLVGGPMYQTVVVVTASGAEQRVQQWSQPRRRWEVRFEKKTGTAAVSLADFFIARGGKARGFRFKDWNDFSTADPSTGVQTRHATAQLTTTTFQLQKAYTSGGVTVTRTIWKPVSGTVTVYNGSTPVGSGFTIDYTTGVITFSSAPGYVPNATFEFDCCARFDTDELQLVQEAPDWREWKGCIVVELLS
jgi:uncharacterized protein (TIGR02217 family)